MKNSANWFSFNVSDANSPAIAGRLATKRPADQLGVAGSPKIAKQ